MEVDSTSPPQGRGRGDGMPSLRLGVGVREDVITLWEELDEARNTLAEIQALLCEIKDPKQTPGRIKFLRPLDLLYSVTVIDLFAISDAIFVGGKQGAKIYSKCVGISREFDVQ